MKTIQISALALILLFLISATPPSKNDRFPKPSAEFKKQSVDWDVFENGQKGMRIHLTFTVYELKGIDCYALITIEKKDGEKYYLVDAKDDLGDYSNLYGDLVVYRKLTPCCETTDYNDLQLFLPYDEISLPTGKYDMRMDVDVTKDFDDTDQDSPAFIGHMNYYTFWFSR